MGSARQLRAGRSSAAGHWYGAPADAAQDGSFQRAAVAAVAALAALSQPSRALNAPLDGPLRPLDSDASGTIARRHVRTSARPSAPLRTAAPGPCQGQALDAHWPRRVRTRPAAAAAA